MAVVLQLASTPCAGEPRFLGVGCVAVDRGRALVFADVDAAREFARRHGCEPAFEPVDAGDRAAA